ncbi:hypothetical protein E2P47_01115 [Candidatus Bathyarchaeota archaeon]|nr:hypothetical protein E2P47_01115 [Candidatus Bathyarchaeota archaeon]
MQLEKIIINWDLQSTKEKECHIQDLSSEVTNIIEENFASIFALPYCNNIFYYLEKNHGITKQNLNENIDKFVTVIEELFGPPIKLVEIKIIEQIHKKIKNFDHTPKKNDLFFRDYLVDLFSHL